VKTCRQAGTARNTRKGANIIFSQRRNEPNEERPIWSHCAIVSSREFYTKYGFAPLPDSNRMFLPMATIEQLFQVSGQPTLADYQSIIFLIA